MQENNASPSSLLLSEIQVHNFLLWVSLSFLMPVEILAMRMSRSEKSERRLRLILQVHATSQIASAILETVAAAMFINNFDNSFNCHQWIGVVVYGLIWLQALIGFLWPQRGCKERRLWFSLHWALGTFLALLGVINMYTGLLVYRDKASRSVKLWPILLSVEISSVAVVYLFQDEAIKYNSKERCRTVKPIMVDQTEMSSLDSKKKELPV